MDCDVTSRLSPFLDGELDAEERSRIEAHLEGCDACAAALHDFRAIGAVAADYTATTGPFDGRRALGAVLASARTPIWRRRVSIPAATIPVAAVAIAAGAIAISRALPPGVQTPAVPRAASVILKYDRGGAPVIAVIPTATVKEDRP